MNPKEEEIEELRAAFPTGKLYRANRDISLYKNINLFCRLCYIRKNTPFLLVEWKNDSMGNSDSALDFSFRAVYGELVGWVSLTYCKNFEQVMEVLHCAMRPLEDTDT